MFKRLSKTHFWRLVIVVVVGLIVATLVPQTIFEPRPEVSSPVPSTVLYTFILGLLIYESIIRDRTLFNSASLELSRLRRLSHVIEGLSGRAKWKSDFRKKVAEYMHSIAENDFKDYERSHEKFRAVTHMIYTFKPKTRHEEIILDELFEVSSELSAHRQQVESYIPSFVPPYTKIAVIILAIINIAVWLASREAGISSTIFVTSAIVGVLLVLDVFFELDHLSRKERRGYQGMYRDDAWDIDHETATKDRK